MESEFYQALTGVFALVLTTAITLGLKWFREKVKSELARNVAGMVGRFASVAVGKVEQTVVAKLKAETLSGKLSEDGGQKALAAGLDTLKELIGLNGLKELSRAGINGNLDGYLTSHLEAAIAEAKPKVVRHAVDPSLVSAPESTPG